MFDFSQKSENIFWLKKNVSQQNALKTPDFGPHSARPLDLALKRRIPKVLASAMNRTMMRACRVNNQRRHRVHPLKLPVFFCIIQSG